MSALISAADVATIYRLDIRHVYVIAHRKRWRRKRIGGRVHYDAGQVHDTLRPETPRTA